MAATIRRAELGVKRALFAGRMTVFYCALDDRRLPQVKVPRALRVERIQSLTELSTEHLHTINSIWNPKLADRSVRERFEKGASLWLVISEDRLAGYGWVLQGRTMEPYYFPLAKDDVHLFDFHVFPDYRGRGINPYLIGRILDGLATNRAGRAFIEAAEWNDAQLSSLRKTPFCSLGTVRSFTILGHTFASWLSSDAGVQIDRSGEPTKQVFSTVRSNEE